MKKHSTQLSLSEIANSDLRAAFILELFGLSFSDNGPMSLEQASEEAGIPIEYVRSTLSRYLDKDFNPEDTLTAILSNIVTVHHSFTWKVLLEIERLFEGIAPGTDLEKARDLFIKMAANIRNHSRDEEQRFFPRLRELEATGIETLSVEELEEELVNMEDDHANCLGALKRLQILTGGYVIQDNDPPDYKLLMRLLRLLEFDLKVHIHKENNLLHRKLKNLLEVK